ncbi:hypothetical protein [Prevotella sp.]
MKLILSKIQKTGVIVLCLFILSISFSSCSDDDDSIPNVENTIWRMVDNYVTNQNTTIPQISFHNGYATYAYVNRHTGVIDHYGNLRAHGRYYYDRQFGGFVIIDEKTGKPYEGLGAFHFKNGILEYSSMTFVLYR